MRKNKSIHKQHAFSLLFTAFFLLFTLIPFLNAQGDTVPQRIILNLTDKPAEEIAITWRTQTEIKGTVVEYMLATALSPEYVPEDGKNPYQETKSVPAVTETVVIDENTSAFQHSVILKGLEPNTLYQYRVGNGEVWSDWNQFRTADKKRKPFKFIYLGDPQNDLTSLCSRVFRAAYTTAPDAGFFLVAGDLINHPWVDEQWGQFIQAAGWMARQVPFTMIPGNHEYYNKNYPEDKTKRLDKLWNHHFTLPENGPEELKESAFYFDYQGVRFIMLNGNEKLPEQAKWLESLLSNNKNRWTIVTIHQPLYSTGLNRDNVRMREIFLPVFDLYSVDLVLQGHDHTYGRTYKLREGKMVNKRSKGTVYVVSVSGPKTYETNGTHRHLMKKIGTGLQLYQVITVKKSTLTYQCYTVTGQLYDSFTLRKR